MSLLQALRQSKVAARCVLVWFALAMAAAVAAPLVNPQSTQLVCSGAGAVKLVSTGSDESVPLQAHSIDCVLCLAISAPPAPLFPGVQAPEFLSYALQPAPAAWVAKRIAAPLPARGPPAA